MQVFKCFFRILYKNKISLGIYVGVFIALTFAFTSSAGDQGKQVFSTEKTKVGIVDLDHTDGSKAFSEYIKKQSNVVEVGKNKKEIQDQMFYQEVEYVMYIPKDYEKKLLAGEKVTIENVKLPNSYVGSFMDMKVNTYLNMISTYITAGMSPDKAYIKAKDTLEDSTEVDLLEGDITAETTPAYGYFFAYYSYVIIIITILGLGLILSQLNQKDMQRRIKVSPMSATSYSLQLAGSCGIFALGVWAVINGLGIVIYSGKDGFLEALPYFALNSFVMTLLAVMLGYLIGMFVKSSNALSGAGNTFSLGFSFLGGVFVPQEYMNANMLHVSQMVPTYWYMKAQNIAMSSDMSKAANRNDFIMAILIQLAFAVALFCIALVVKKVRTKE